jgi:hypothetical protein
MNRPAATFDRLTKSAHVSRCGILNVIPDTRSCLVHASSGIRSPRVTSVLPMGSSPGLALAGGKGAGPLSPGVHPSLPGSAGGRGRRIPQGRPALLPGSGTYSGGTRECAPASCGAHGCTPRSFRDGGSASCVQGQSSTMPGASPRVEGSRLRFMKFSAINFVTLSDYFRKNNLFRPSP